MHTKPASCFLQLIGGLLLLIGIIAFFAANPSGLILVAIGGLILWWGGKSTRERIRSETRK